MDAEAKERRKRTEEKVKKDMEGLIKRITEYGEKCTPFPDANPPAFCDLQELRELCIRVREQVLIEPAFVKVPVPTFVFGDLHGQLTDLVKMLSIVGTPPQKRLLFLGDYVDRGSYSVETVSLLLAYKLRYPKQIYLLRGNHETRFVNRQYGFFDECQRKYTQAKGVELWTQFQHVFNCLPVAALVGSAIFCAHGGISEDLLSFKQFERIKRPTDITDLGLLTDLLWSDPSPITEKYTMSPRGVSSVFGKEAISHFCSQLDVDLILRAHQCVMDGYEFFADRKCLTIFSAPCYCGEVDNAAGIFYVNKNLQAQIYVYKSGNKPKEATNQTTEGTPGKGEEKEKFEN